VGSLAPGLLQMTVVGLTLALATACGDGGTTTRAGTPVSSSSGTPAMASADPTASEPLTVSVGDSAGPLRAALGAPSAERQLTNDAPNTMGAELIEYAFAREAAQLVAADGSATPARNVQFVLNKQGRVLRILENPNAFGAAGQRQQLGSAGPLPVAVIFNADALTLKRTTP
jgi:hypothetical protein